MILCAEFVGVATRLLKGSNGHPRQENKVVCVWAAAAQACWRLAAGSGVPREDNGGGVRMVRERRVGGSGVMYVSSYKRKRRFKA